jgi:hypothetical protein
VPPSSTSTKAGGVNDRGQVVGVGYPRLTGNAGGFGFLRGRHGHYTTFRVPGTGPDSRTVATDIDTRGRIVGWSDDGMTSFGYIRDRGGDFTRIEHPDARGSSLLGSGTNVTGINARGDIVGNYAADGTVYGFVRDRRGNFTTIRPTGAAAVNLTAINDHGAVVGQSSELGVEELLDNAAPGFVLSKDAYREIAFPGASITVPNGITNSGRIAGTYGGDDGTPHGFLRTKRGNYTSIENPDAAGRGTAVYAINNRGETTGAYVSSAAEARAVPQALRAGQRQAARPLSDPRFTR